MGLDFPFFYMSSDWKCYFYHSSIDHDHCNCSAILSLESEEWSILTLCHGSIERGLTVFCIQYVGNCRDDRLCIFIDWFKTGSKAPDKAIFFWQSPVMFGIVDILNPIKEKPHLHSDKSTWAKSSPSYRGLIYFNLNSSLGGLCMASKYLILLNINWVFNSCSIQIYRFACYLHAVVDIN